MFSRRRFTLTTAGLLVASRLRAGDQPTTAGLTYENPQPSTWRLSMEVEAPSGLAGGLATFPVPMPWPEQEVRLVSRDASDLIGDVQFRDTDGVRQAVIAVPRLRVGESAKFECVVEVIKRDIVAPPLDTQWVLPSRRERWVREYFGNSPEIDAGHYRIRSLSRDLTGEFGEDADGWRMARTIYLRVRELVKYREGPIRKASEALVDGFGDCEDMSSLFIALCRNVGIPARLVWIVGHAYPEFGLLPGPEGGLPAGGGQPAGGGRRTADELVWFPCQVAGSEAFGKMAEARPILQKGDRYQLPERQGVVRYVSETFIARQVGPTPPTVRFGRVEIAAAP